MAISSRFNFVSPGISIQEVDNSQLPAEPINSGPAIIGRMERGPAMRPVKVSSRSEFVETFGNPIAGGRGGDVWREGNKMGPTYAAYAAFAWLKAGVGPATIVRLLGADHTNATSAGEAGWATELEHNPANASNGGAFGLFLIPSGVVSDDTGTGSLAAVWYLNHAQGASIVLSGNMAQSGTFGQITTEAPVTGTCVLVDSQGPSREFRAVIRDGVGDTVYETNFNFDRNSDRFIRKVFNTNPVLTNTSITDVNNLQPSGSAYYWLGETYENWIDDTQHGLNYHGIKQGDARRVGAGHDLANSGSTAGDTYGVILPLKSGSDGAGTGGSTVYNRGENRAGFVNSQTGWFFAQDITTDYATYNPHTQQRLFKFHSRDQGEWLQNNMKVSISDLKLSTNESDPYGTFTVELRRAQDTDGAKQVVEKFTNCSLNPSSVNYIARKIGDKYMDWSDNTSLLVEKGQYDNQSRYIRVEVNSDVEGGSTDPIYLPFGVWGPPTFKGFMAASGSINPLRLKASLGDNDTLNVQANAWVSGSLHTNASAQADARYGVGVIEQFIQTQPGQGCPVPGTTTAKIFTGSFIFPSTRLRRSGSNANVSDVRDAYFGVITTRTRTGTTFDDSWPDYLRALPEPDDLNITFPDANNAYDAKTGANFSWCFSLDDLATGSSAAEPFYASGSRVLGLSISQIHGSASAVLELGFDRFTAPFYGGYDGIDITEKEPFGNHVITSAATETTNYGYYSVKRAIKTIADPEVVDCNMIAAPGIRNQKLTEFMIATAESRGDSMAVIDIEDVYTPKTETTNSYANRLGDVDTAVKQLKSRNINSSYACTYYPWVQIRDSLNGAMLWVPPSVIALGVFASSQAKSELWFAPAGFTRGGLSEGSAGLAVTGLTERLTKKDRDTLYGANINPIASFPNEGIVMFGQKTLQVTPSALDRINVRRLMIFLKKRISFIASRILFDQNVKATWQRFKSQVEPFLGSVKARLGLTEFKVVLDETTTTPDLVDRNILYAKIFLKPARSIEFIAIDFVITRTGAAFED